MSSLSKPEDHEGMDGRVFLVTGASDGIGKRTALRLAQAGATVLMHGRPTGKLPLAVREIADRTGSARLEAYAADLSSLAQVRDLSDEIHRRHGRLDVLVNNAGVCVPPASSGSEDGHETAFAVNVLAPFLLTSLLLDLLGRGDSSRVVHVSSALHREHKTPLRVDDFITNNNNNNNNINEDEEDRAWTHITGREAYARSKLCQVLYTYRMAHQAPVRSANVTVNCLHPGRLPTKLFRQAWGGQYTGAAPVMGDADYVFWAATEPALDGVTGRYFEGGRDTASSDVSYSKEQQDMLWDLLVNLTGAVY